MQASQSFILSNFSLYTAMTMDSYGSTSLSSSRAPSITTSLTTTRTSATSSADPLYQLRSQLTHAHWTRRYLFDIVMHSYFNSFVLLIILINTIALALQVSTFINANYGWYLGVLDSVFLGIYIIEAALKIFVMHLKYFMIGWNVFDFVIILSSILAFVLPILFHSTSSFNPDIIRLFRIFRAFRAIRSLRALRAIAFFGSLQVIVETLLQSIPAISSILSLAFLVLYIFAVIGRTLYGKIDTIHFGSLFYCFFSLFSFITLDNWSDVFHKNKQTVPDIFVYIFLFILLETFVLLNLFIAVICSNLDTVRLRMTKLQRRDTRAPPLARATSSVLSSTSRLSGSAEMVMAPFSPSMQSLVAALVSTDVQTFYDPAKSHVDLALLGGYFMQLAALEHAQRGYHALESAVDGLVGVLVSSTAQKPVSNKAEEERGSAGRRRGGWARRVWEGSEGGSGVFQIAKNEMGSALG